MDEILKFREKFKFLLPSFEWKFKYFLIPETCFVTKKLLWLRKHYAIKIYMNNVKEYIEIYMDLEIGTMIQMME